MFREDVIKLASEWLGKLDKNGDFGKEHPIVANKLKKKVVEWSGMPTEYEAFVRLANEVINKNLEAITVVLTCGDAEKCVGSAVKLGKDGEIDYSPRRVITPDEHTIT